MADENDIILFKCISCGYEEDYKVSIEDENIIIRHYPICPVCKKFEGMKPKLKTIEESKEKGFCLDYMKKKDELLEKLDDDYRNDSQEKLNLTVAKLGELERAEGERRANERIAGSVKDLCYDCEGGKVATKKERERIIEIIEDTRGDEYPQDKIIQRLKEGK